MKQNQASRTAQYAAAFRALETLRRPERARLFEDPFAIGFLSPGLKRAMHLAALPFCGALVRRYIDYRWPGAMTSGIARTRLIDDWLAESLRGKEGRVIILGAGYDCRAYRIEALSRCRVLEIDHPDTQSQKMKMLVSDFGGLPPHVKLIGADLTKTDLRDVITGEAFASKEPAFVIWEGVTHYLGEAAVDGTLRALSDVLPAGSRLVFTYLHAGLLDGSVSFWGAGISKKQVAGEGEPWVWGMDPAGMPDYLKERGFALIEDLGADDYRERYWGQKGKRMRGFSFYRVALARSV